MVHVNETIVIKSDSPKVAEWVKRMKAYKAENWKGCATRTSAALNFSSNERSFI